MMLSQVGMSTAQLEATKWHFLTSTGLSQWRALLLPSYACGPSLRLRMRASESCRRFPLLIFNPNFVLRHGRPPAVRRRSRLKQDVRQ